MNAAQTAFAVLTGLFVVAATVVFAVGEMVPAYVMLGVAIIGFLSLGGMIFSDARADRTTPAGDG